MIDYNTISSLEELETAHLANVEECGGGEWYRESGEDLYNLYMTHYYRLKFVELAKEELTYLHSKGCLNAFNVFRVVAELLYRNNQYDVIKHLQYLKGLEG